MQRIAYLFAAHPESMIWFAREISGRRNWWIISSDESYTALRTAGVRAEDARLLFGRTALDASVFTMADIVRIGLRTPASAQAPTALAGYGLAGIDLLYLDPHAKSETPPAQSRTTAVTETFDDFGAALLTAAAEGKKYVLTTPEQGRLFVRFLEAGEPDAARVAAALGRGARWVAAQCMLNVARRHGPADGTGAVTPSVHGAMSALLVPVH